MSELGAALAAFAAMALSHAAWMRRGPRGVELKPVIGLGLLWLAPLAVWLARPGGRHEVSLPVTAGLLYLMLALWYVSTCNVLRYQSPSLIIVRLLLDRPDRRAARAELAAAFSDAEFLLPRIQELVDGGHLRRDGERLVITPRGRLVVRGILAYRAVLGLGVGG